MPTPNSVGTPGYFAHGDGTDIPYTVLSSDWANGIQQELVNVVQAAGLTLSKTSQTQLLSAIGILGRVKLTGILNLYVNSSGGSDTNNGLTSGTAYATLQKATNVALQNYDTQGFNINVNVAAGNYTVGASMVGGLFGGGYLHFIGNVGSPSTVTVNLASTGYCFVAAWRASMQVSGISMSAPHGGVGLGVAIGVCLGASLSGVIVFDNCIFAATQYCHMATGSGAYIQCNGPYQITGGALAHMIAGSGAGSIVVALQTITLTGTPTFANAFAFADGAGVINAPSNVYSGSAIGPRYAISNGGYIATNGGGASYFPGSTVGGGTILSGGFYV